MKLTAAIIIPALLLLAAIFTYNESRKANELTKQIKIIENQLTIKSSIHKDDGEKMGIKLQPINPEQAINHIIITLSPDLNKRLTIEEDRILNSNDLFTELVKHSEKSGIPDFFADKKGTTISNTFYIPAIFTLDGISNGARVITNSMYQIKFEYIRQNNERKIKILSASLLGHLEEQTKISEAFKKIKTK